MRKKLTRENYAEKFKKMMEVYNFVPQDGEIIMQCHEPYPGWWFISNTGYLYSGYFKNIKVLKPHYRKTGKENKNGERMGHDWYYVYNNNEGSPHPTMHKLIAEHFLKCDINYDNEELEVHHIKKRKSFKPDEAVECNKADNLQILPVSVHDRATYYGNHTQGQIDRDNEERIKKTDYAEEQINISPKEWEHFWISVIQDSIERGTPVYGYFMPYNDPDNLDEKEVSVYQIKAVGYKE